MPDKHIGHRQDPFSYRSVKIRFAPVANTGDFIRRDVGAVYSAERGIKSQAAGKRLSFFGGMTGNAIAHFY